MRSWKAERDEGRGKQEPRDWAWHDGVAPRGCGPCVLQQERKQKALDGSFVTLQHPLPSPSPPPFPPAASSSSWPAPSCSAGAAWFASTVSAPPLAQASQQACLWPTTAA